MYLKIFVSDRWTPSANQVKIQTKCDARPKNDLRQANFHTIQWILTLDFLFSQEVDFFEGKMTEPTFGTEGQRRLIRIYSYFEHPHQIQETDSSGEEPDAGLDKHVLAEQTDEMRLARNERYFADHLPHYTTSVQGGLARNGREIQTILRPTLVKISSFCLHPNLCTRIQPVPTLRDMARILHTDPNWEEKYATDVASNHFVLTTLQTFLRSAADARSAKLQLAVFVQNIGIALDLDMTPHSD